MIFQQQTLVNPLLLTSLWQKYLVLSVKVNTVGPNRVKTTLKANPQKECESHGIGNTEWSTHKNDEELSCLSAFVLTAWAKLCSSECSSMDGD